MNLVYFDLETQKSAAEVGGWHNKASMRMSVGVTYSTQRGLYTIYDELRAPDLICELQRADLVVGFNILDFDYTVLTPYCVFDMSQTPTLDLITQVENYLGKRVGLNSIAIETLGTGKTAIGTDALKWWKEGRIKEIAEYCCFDVKTTMLVHEYGARNGHVFYRDKHTEKREKILTPNWKI